MSVTVNELIKLLDTEGNRYGGATGKPRELNISINGNFCGSIKTAKLDGFGDGLVTDVTLEIEAPKMREYYDKGIRDNVIEELKELVEGHKYVNAEDGTTIEEILKNEETEKKYAWYLSRNQCCDWMLHRLDEIAEKMKEDKYWISDEDGDGNKKPTIRKCENRITHITITENGIFVNAEENAYWIGYFGGRYALLTYEEAEEKLRKLN